MLKSLALAKTDPSRLFVHTPLPGERGDFKVFKQWQVAGVIEEKNPLSTTAETGDLPFGGQLRVNTELGLLYTNRVTGLFTARAIHFREHFRENQQHGMTDCCLVNLSALFKHSGKFQRSLAQRSAETADLAVSRWADLPEANCSS